MPVSEADNSRDSVRRVALITGCGKALGIGSACARALSAAGFSLVLTDIALQGLANDLDERTDSPPGWKGIDSLECEIAQQGGQAICLTGDVSSEADAIRLVRQALDHFGRLDVLVNNAGAPHGDDRVDIESMSLAAWERVMSINVRGAFLMSREAIRPMRRQRWGRIVNMASAIVRHPMRERAAYIASKSALIGLTEAMALDVADSGITVNAVCPGSVRTARAISSTRKAGFSDIEAGLAERARGIPAGRHAEAAEIAATVAFLCSEPAGYLTGQSIFVDGGGLPRPLVPPHR